MSVMQSKLHSGHHASNAVSVWLRVQSGCLAGDPISRSFSASHCHGGRSSKRDFRVSARLMTRISWLSTPSRRGRGRGGYGACLGSGTLGLCCDRSSSVGLLSQPTVRAALEKWTEWKYKWGRVCLHAAESQRDYCLDEWTTLVFLRKAEKHLQEREEKGLSMRMHSTSTGCHCESDI